MAIGKLNTLNKFGINSKIKISLVHCMKITLIIN